MKNVQRLAFSLIAAAVVASASDVHDLKTDTFKPFIEENKLVLAEFFAPWCGHCKALAPEYEEAATTLKEKSIPLAKIDCTEEADLCSEYGVSGYPTLKVFRGLEDIKPYSGQRKSAAIISYMTKQALPAVSNINAETLEDFKIADKVVVVAYFDAKDTKTNETFSKIADSKRDDYLFGASADPDVAKAEGVSQPGLVLYKQFDEGKTVFDGKWEDSAISEWIKVASTPLVGEVGPDTYTSYMEALIPLGYIFAEESTEREAFAKEFKAIAEKHKGKVNLAVIDAKQFGQHGENLNLKVGEWPAFAIQDIANNKKYPMKQGEKLTEASVGKFVDDFVAGKLEPSIKSEPIPEKQEGPVTVIVAHTFDDLVINNDKDVLVEYYAPWCGHCKALAPKYEDLARLYNDHTDKVVVAKVDATANDVPEEIAGFPTIKLYPGKGKGSDPIEYSGSRSVEDLANFIRDNGSHKVDAWVPEPEESDAAKTEDMQHQAAAATEKAKEAAGKVAEKVQEVVDGAVGAGGAEPDDHDEL